MPRLVPRGDRGEGEAMDEEQYKRRVVKWRGGLGGLLVLIVYTLIDGVHDRYDVTFLLLLVLAALVAVGMLVWLPRRYARTRAERPPEP